MQAAQRLPSDTIIASDGCRIAYCLEGDNRLPTLLLANSLGTNMWLWAPQMLEFKKHFRVLRYDMRGHGASDVPLGDYSLDRVAQDAVDLLDALKLKKVLFCGLSLGGMVGQWLGAHVPSRITALALCNTSAYMGPEVWRERIALVRANGMTVITDAVMNRWLTTDFQKAYPELTQALRDILLSTPAEGYTGACAAIRDMDLRGLMVGNRTLVVGGRHDLATPPSHAEQIAQSISGARLEMLNAAHLSNWECRAEFGRLVIGFLAGR